MKESETATRFSVCHCLGAWDWWSGLRDMETRDNRYVRQQRDAEMMQVAILGGVNAVQRRQPVAVRCTAASWTS